MIKLNLLVKLSVSQKPVVHWFCGFLTANTFYSKSPFPVCVQLMICASVNSINCQ